MSFHSRGCSHRLFSPGVRMLLVDFAGLKARSLVSEVLQEALAVGLHGLGARGPTRRAHLARVVLDVLQGLQGAERLIHRAPEGQVVDGAVLDDALAIDDEEATERDMVSGQDIETLADVLAEVAHERVRKGSPESTDLLLGTDPCKMGVDGVHTDANNFSIDCREVGIAISERHQLSRANEGEIKGIEEENHVFTTILFQRDFRNCVVHNRWSFEARSSLANQKAISQGDDRQQEDSDDTLHLPDS
mmetsp:Transcript_33873/g.89664  ORF Transcript_33873/g.89664 Transcript_33873/m.89664 type:complete len:247 (+) Transcript_33873:17-757(+)